MSETTSVFDNAHSILTLLIAIVGVLGTLATIWALYLQHNQGKLKVSLVAAETRLTEAERKLTVAQRENNQQILLNKLVEQLGFYATAQAESNKQWARLADEVKESNAINSKALSEQLALIRQMVTQDQERQQAQNAAQVEANAKIGEMATALSVEARAIEAFGTAFAKELKTVAEDNLTAYSLEMKNLRADLMHNLEGVHDKLDGLDKLIKDGLVNGKIEGLLKALKEMGFDLRNGLKKVEKAVDELNQETEEKKPFDPGATIEIKPGELSGNPPRPELPKGVIPPAKKDDNRGL